jgi:hypothetical protein
VKGGDPAPGRDPAAVDHPFGVDPDVTLPRAPAQNLASGPGARHADGPHSASMHIPPPSSAPGQHGAVRDPIGSDLHQTRRWSGHPGEPFVVGEPGRSFHEVVPRLISEPWERPDTVIDAGRVGGLDVRAVSLRGLSHRYNGVTRQDSYGLGTDPAGRWLVAVVADGVSGGRLSHVAASLVARLGPELVVEQLQQTHPADIAWYGLFEQLAGSILRNGYRRIKRDRPELPPLDQMEKMDRSERERILEDVAQTMASTATILVCATEPNQRGDREFLVAWLGDSPAWQLGADGGWTCLSEVKDSGRELACSAVVALPRIPPLGIDVAHAVGFLRPDEALFVMTDGVGDPLGDATGDVGDFLAAVWRRPPDVLTFVAQVGFGRQSYDDDRTVVGVWCASDGVE